MTYDFSGKTAVVTGASRGLGEAIARTLAEDGARVILVARMGGPTCFILPSLRFLNLQLFHLIAAIASMPSGGPDRAAPLRARQARQVRRKAVKARSSGCPMAHVDAQWLKHKPLSGRNYFRRRHYFM